MLGRFDQLVRRAGGSFASAVVVIEYRVDNRSLPCSGIDDQIADRVRGLVEEGLDIGLVQTRTFVLGFFHRPSGVFESLSSIGP